MGGWMPPGRVPGAPQPPDYSCRGKLLQQTIYTKETELLQNLPGRQASKGQVADIIVCCQKFLAAQEACAASAQPGSHYSAWEQFVTTVTTLPSSSRFAALSVHSMGPTITKEDELARVLL